MAVDKCRPARGQSRSRISGTLQAVRTGSRAELTSNRRRSLTLLPGNGAPVTGQDSRENASRLRCGVFSSPLAFRPLRLLPRPDLPGH